MLQSLYAIKRFISVRFDKIREIYIAASYNRYHFPFTVMFFDGAAIRIITSDYDRLYGLLVDVLVPRRLKITRNPRPRTCNRRD